MPQETEWMGIAFSVLKWGAVAGAGFLASSAYEWTKRFYFVGEEWKIEFGAQNALGEYIYTDEPEPNKPNHAKLSGKIKLFSRKAYVIALHKPAIEFTQGRWPFRRLIYRIENLSHGPRLGHGPITEFATLSEITVPPNEWVVERLHTLFDRFEPIRESNLWFVAETVEGKRKRWFLTGLQKHRS